MASFIAQERTRYRFDKQRTAIRNCHKTKVKKVKKLKVKKSEMVLKVEYNYQQLC